MSKREKYYAHNIPAARQLRTNQTRSEALLWESLRSNPLNGLKFRRQHAIGRFVVDFYCDDSRLVVEIDGAIHLGPEQQARDQQRQRELEGQDLEFLRVSADDVEQCLPHVLEKIAQAVRARGTYSSKNTTDTPPLPQRRERGPGGEGQCA